MWQEDDVGRIFWLAERLGLDPLERELIAIVEDQTPLKPLGFMVTVDGWVKLHYPLGGVCLSMGCARIGQRAAQPS